MQKSRTADSSVNLVSLAKTILKIRVDHEGGLP
jgi:hypothetical protein